MSDVNLYVGNYLSLSYLKEELETNNISISSDKSYKEYETQEKRYMFDPEETGE